jgi:hypothetical protein
MRHPLGLAEHLKGHVLELDAEVLGDHGAGGEDRNVFEHRLAAISEPRSLDRRDLKAAAQFVDDERRQGFAFDVFGNDEQRLASLDDGLKDGEQRLKGGKLLLVDEDVGVLKLGHHLLGIGDEIGRESGTRSRVLSSSAARSAAAASSSRAVPLSRSPSLQSARPRLS